MGLHGYPDGNVLYRNLHITFPVIRYGRGSFLYDAEGNEYLDASGGAAVCNIGHGVEEVADAMSIQAKAAGYLNGLQFTHAPVEELAARIAEHLPFPEGKVFFLTSGSEAVEAAIKLARQYWVEVGRVSKYKVISRSPSYHGNTLAALSLSARKHYQEAFQPLLMESPKIPAPYCYRCPWGEAYPDCQLKCARELEKEVERQGPETVAAFITEVVGGSSTGAAVPPPDYFETIREICQKYDLMLIADEVMTGVGRTGTWLACERYGLSPDIIVLGKGLTSGYFPLSALAVTESLVDAIFDRGHNFLHAQTFAHHPVGCAAALATLTYISKNSLVSRCAEIGHQLRERLSSLDRHATVGDVRGIGLLVGVEFVQDREGREPIPRAERFAERFVLEARRRGLIVWPNVGHADGTNGDLILIAPPFTISRREVEIIVERLSETLAQIE